MKKIFVKYYKTGNVLTFLPFGKEVFYMGKSYDRKSAYIK
jgi:hypothetical protein